MTWCYSIFIRMQPQTAMPGKRRQIRLVTAHFDTDAPQHVVIKTRAMPTLLRRAPHLSCFLFCFFLIFNFFKRPRKLDVVRPSHPLAYGITVILTVTVTPMFSLCDAKPPKCVCCKLMLRVRVLGGETFCS